MAKKISFSRTLLHETKGKVFPALIKHHAMRIYVGVEIKLHAVQTLALHTFEWSASSSDLLTSGERAPGIQ